MTRLLNFITGIPKLLVAALVALGVVLVSVLALGRQFASGARAKSERDQLKEAEDARKKMDDVPDASRDDVVDSLRRKNF